MCLLHAIFPRPVVAQRMNPPTAPNAVWRNPLRTILLVDDDARVRERLCRVLAGQSLRVITATNDEEALRLIDRHGPDLVIADLNVVTISGGRMLEQLHDYYPDLPVIVISALPATALRGTKEFVAAFFLKPLEIDALLAAIRYHLSASGSELIPK